MNRKNHVAVKFLNRSLWMSTLVLDLMSLPPFLMIEQHLGLVFPSLHRLLTQILATLLFQSASPVDAELRLIDSVSFHLPIGNLSNYVVRVYINCHGLKIICGKYNFYLTQKKRRIINLFSAFLK